MIERTLFIIKPDAVKRNLVSQILSDVRASGLKLLVQKKVALPRETLEGLYEEHFGKGFYGGLVDFMGSGVVVCAVLEGEGAIGRLRELMGNTYPSKASPESIRGKYKLESDTGPTGVVENMVHGSDSPERAKKEIELIFGKEWSV